MASGEKQKTSSKKAAGKSRAIEIANTFEWLITAFVLAFLFRAFVMEAFRIPTGSMADTLKGAHFRLRCLQCGYKYEHGFVPEKYGFPQDYIPHKRLRSYNTRCPSCGHYQPVGGTMRIANGDRILVLKCIYQFLEPKQWDVIVFKNPLDPAINYIKRLVARPGETVEIIDGDVYINGQISRKPRKVQQELWMPVYDNDFQPVLPEERSFNGHAWQQPFRNETNSSWKNDRDNSTLFYLESPADQINTMIYDTSIGNEFRAAYAYDDIREYAYMPYCSDLMVRFCVNPGDAQGRVGMELSKYQTRYRAWFDFAGEMVIEKISGAEAAEELSRRRVNPAMTNETVLAKFANVDHQLIFEFGDEKLKYDMERGPDDIGERKTNIEPQVRIFGSGKLRLSHVAIFRDIHYTASKYANSSSLGRAIEGNPFTLGKDEFFVLGDNSPNSEDARWWSQPGRANNDRHYRPGVVPRDYLVGKALFVYWPSGFRPLGFRFGIIPNVGQMRLIYGGSRE